MTISQTAQEFVRRINAHDVESIMALTSIDFVLVDSLGNRFTRPAIDEGWRQYFAMVPDYWIKIDDAVLDRDAVILFGTAGGTYVPKGGKMMSENRWETPAVWRAVARDGQLMQWRIYADNEPLREKTRAGNQ
jgi:ketosteroid isomerase-like protein